MKPVESREELYLQACMILGTATFAEPWFSLDVNDFDVEFMWDHVFDPQYNIMPSALPSINERFQDLADFFGFEIEE